VRDRPAEGTVGETLAITFDVTNTVAAPAEAALGIKPGARFTLLDTGDFDPATRLILAAGQTRTITAHVRADAANVLNPAEWPALDLTLAGSELEPRGLRVPVAIGFAEGSRTCGERRFPEFHTTPGENYGNAACCEGVFYPGAQCCSSADCVGGGTCVDGVCATAAPNIQYSGSPLAGPQRVLVVFVDEPEPKPPRVAITDPCTDQAAQRGADLGLPDIETWFAESARRRVGRPLTSFRFTVLGGVKTSDLDVTSFQPTSYGPAVERFLRVRGCTGPWSEDFDRVVIVAPMVATGEHQGLVYAADRVAVQLWSASITTHELAHTFGATDRYFDVGGTLQYGGLLMSTVSGPPAALGDGVFWGEAGLGDLDRDGAVDALTFSRAPERLELAGLGVEGNPRNRTLSVAVRISAREGERSLVVLPRAIELEVAGVAKTLTIDDHRPGLGLAERDRYLASLRAGEEVPDAVFDEVMKGRKTRVRVRVDHRYTDAAFQRRAVVLEETREVEVAVDEGRNPGPRP
jgi:hypothetical protein